MAKAQAPFRLRAYEVWGVCKDEFGDWKRLEWTGATINAAAPGKARFEYLLRLQDAGWSLSIVNIRSRVAGPPQTSNRLARVAERRGLPFVKAGMLVECEGKSGRIVDGNDSNNFDVAFESGHIGNCHPHWRMKYFADDGTLLHDSEVRHA